MTDSAINCMAVVAHADDEALSCGAWLLDRKARGWNTHVLVVFGRKYNYGQGDQKLQDQIDALDHSCLTLNVDSWTGLWLEEGEPTRVGYYQILKEIESKLDTLRPVEVVIPDSQDRNQDHTFLNEVCQITVRPWAYPSIKRVLMCQSPDGSPKITNHYVPVTEDMHHTQIRAVECYAQEVRGGAHPRSPVNLDAWQRVHGSHAYLERAEPYRLLYSKD
jgi:LmbE family N-acetylglucosaminyl deacetylase